MFFSAFVWLNPQSRRGGPGNGGLARPPVKQINAPDRRWLTSPLFTAAVWKVALPTLTTTQNTPHKKSHWAGFTDHFQIKDAVLRFLEQTDKLHREEPQTFFVATRCRAYSLRRLKLHLLSTKSNSPTSCYLFIFIYKSAAYVLITNTGHLSPSVSPINGTAAAPIGFLNQRTLR